MPKRTSLFEEHIRSGARMIEFGGWEMPVQYSTITDEHRAVRRAGGLFDISHMGEIFLAGAEAGAFLDRLLTNDVGRLEEGAGQYTLMCNSRGGVVDDLYLYRLEAQRYLMIVNASRIEADVDWMERNSAERRRAGTVGLANRSEEMGAVAIQGPRVREFIDDCFTGPSTKGTGAALVSDLRRNTVGQFQFQGRGVWVARTGYTGEDGFEAVARADLMPELWRALLDRGRQAGLQPAGLGARDTLRTEMGYPLYGHELDEDTSPLEAGLSHFVSFQKPEFLGKPILEGQKAEGVTRRCVAFRMEGKAPPPRPHYSVWSAGADSTRIGAAVSGTASPSLGLGIGTAYVAPQFAGPGTRIQIEIRGRRFPAVIVKKPLYRRKTSR